MKVDIVAVILTCITASFRKNCVTTDFIQYMRIVYQHFITIHKA